MIDPITFEVLRHRLATIVDEGAAVMRNVSGSPSVAQSNDCNVALLTTSGEGVIIGRTIASHAMSCIHTSRYVLKEYQDLTFLEIAEILDVPLSTVKTRLYRGLGQMRLRLERQGIKSAAPVPAALP